MKRNVIGWQNIGTSMVMSYRCKHLFCYPYSGTLFCFIRKRKEKNSEMTKSSSLFDRKASAWFKGLGIIMIVMSHFAGWWSWFFTEEGTKEIIRNGVERCGPYGVAIFFLFSGYGLVKSAGKKRIDWRFVVKRFISVYIPYLVILTLITLLSGGFAFEKPGDLGRFLYGENYWYMTVLFTFYLGFMAIWFVFANTHIRAVLMSIFTYWYSNHLYVSGNADFWYISNIAFAIGVLFALYEPYVKKVMDKLGIVFAIVFGIGSGMVVYRTLYTEQVFAEPIDEIRCSIVAVTVFTLFVASFCAVWKWYDPVLPIFGSYSLYFYLTHTFLFMWTINNGNIHEEMEMRFLIAAGIIAVVSIVFGIIMDMLFGPIERLLKKEKKEGATV